MPKRVARHSRRRVLPLCAALVAFAAGSLLFSTAASAAPSPITTGIAQNAQFISPFQINVPMTLSCAAGSGYDLSLSVVQPEGFQFTMFGGGNASGQPTCGPFLAGSPRGRSTERHRSRTCLASGYDAVLVLKTSRGTGPGRSAADTS